MDLESVVRESRWKRFSSCTKDKNFWEIRSWKITTLWRIDIRQLENEVYYRLLIDREVIEELKREVATYKASSSSDAEMLRKEL